MAAKFEFKFQVQAALEILGWSQAELARRLYVHPNTVTGWATGRTKVPGPVVAYLGLAVKAKEMLNS